MSQYVKKTVMKQFSNSPMLLQLLDFFYQWVDADRFSDEVLKKVWDIQTANGYGLDVWGRILGLPRYLSGEAKPEDNFGFNVQKDEDGNPAPDPDKFNWKPWNTAPFWSGDKGLMSYRLEDGYYRRLLLIKASANIARCDPDSLNSILRSLFGDKGACWASFDPDTPMHLYYNFDFFPARPEKTLIESGILPVPAGMKLQYNYRILNYSPFGFSGNNKGSNKEFVVGFNQSPFFSSVYTPKKSD